MVRQAHHERRKNEDLTQIPSFVLNSLRSTHHDSIPLSTQGVQKGRPARPQGIWRAKRTAVREHDKGPRTQLAGFFNALLGVLPHRPFKRRIKLMREFYNVAILEFRLQG